MKDLVKKYGLKKFYNFYRWEVSGIETNGYVIKELKNNRYMIANEIIVVELNGIPHIEHCEWIGIESWFMEYKLKELKKQWEAAVMKIKEYRIRQKLDLIESDF